MARKKIVFIIVEGPSDDEALEVLFEKVFDSSTVYVHITHGDITSDPKSDPVFILSGVANMVKAYANSNHLTYRHFQEIIHIVDTDGVFIPDSCITEDPAVSKTFYSLTEIRTFNAHRICNRNESKRKALARLIGAQKIWNIPYQAYYMSCNLDHVLHNKQNSNDEEKEKDALAFAQKYRNDINAFVEFITKSDFSVILEYIDSWEYIKQNLHSLERHTNLGICLKALEPIDIKQL